MGKIDDMRKLREERFAEAQRHASPRMNGTMRFPLLPPPLETSGADLVEAPAITSGPTHAKAERSSRCSVADAKAKCSGCGKIRAIHNGLIARHQKGLGKICIGSRKDPA